MNELIIPDSVRIIDFYAFSQNSIKKFIISKNLEKIGSGAFSDNINLEKFEVSNNNMNFSSPDGALYDKNVTVLFCVPCSLRNYIIPSTVKQIMRRSINQIYSYNIWIPHAVTHIERESFFKIPNVKSIHVLGNIDKLDDNITYDISKLQSFFYHGTKIYNESGAFANRNNIKVFACNEYNSSYFAGVKVAKFGSCYRMNRSCKPKQTSFMNRNILVSIIIFSIK